jgi:hypothetical protein
MHIDAAYAGSAFICPEFRPLLNGVEVSSCEIVALRKKISTDRRATIRMVQKVAHKNVRALLHLFPHFLTQCAKKNSIKKILQIFVN